jgi:iron complex transport system substrate-binding protein
MKRLLWLAVLCILIGFSSLSIGLAQDDSSFPVTVVDESGAEYTFEQPVERIVCLSAACIDDLYTIGLEPIAIADWIIEFYRELYGEVPEDLPIVASGGGYSPDVEQIIALEPDVVMGLLGAHDAVRDPLEATGTIAFLLAAPNNADETIEALRLTAAITGQQLEAEDAITAFNQRVAAYQEAVPGDASVMLVNSFVGNEVVYVETPAAQNCAMFEAYGLASCPFELPQSAGAFATFGFAEITFEAILEVDPEFIFFIGYNDLGQQAPEVVAALEENPLWSALSAVQDERFYSAIPILYNGTNGLSLLGLTLDDAMQKLYPDELDSEVMSAGEAAFPVTVVDKTGAEYTFEQPVERIVCMSTACIDALMVLDITPLAIPDVSISVYEQLNGELPADMPVISTGGGYMPDIEQIIALEPDVILGQMGVVNSVRESLEATGRISVLLAAPITVEETISHLQLVADITGKHDLADTATARFRDKLAAYQAAVPGDKSLMVVSGMADIEVFYVETPQAQTCGMFEEYGLATCPFELPENAGAFGGFGYAEYTFEAILAADPEIIFFLGFNELGEAMPEILDALYENPLWMALSAVQTEQVYSVSSSVFTGGDGVALLERALDRSMSILYPDVYTEVSEHAGS